MIRYFLYTLCFICIAPLVNGQSKTGIHSGGDILITLTEEDRGGQVHLDVDSLLVANYYKFVASNMKVSGIPGYRIRIYSESGLGAREEQQRVRARFLSLYPGIDAYNRYDEPFFKVYIGDCRTKSEALILYDEVKENFSNPIIVEDYINETSAD